MKFLTLLWSVTLLFSATVLAESLVQKSQRVFDDLQQQLSALKQQNELTEGKVAVLVESVLLPNIDRKFFTYKALGKNLGKLNQDEKQEFMQYFTQRLLKSYASPLVKYNNETFKVIDTKLSESGKLAATNFKVTGSKRTVSMQTKWRYSEEAQSWLMYDLVVEGISLLQTQQKELASLFGKHTVSEVIGKLKKT